MIHFFIFGRNPILSYVELVSYLESNKIEYKEITVQNNFFLAEFDDSVNFDIQNFGGVIKIGKVRIVGSFKEFTDYIHANELVEKDKFTYSVIGNMEDDLFTEKFKKEKRKAIIRRGRKQLKLESGDSITIPSAEVEFFCYEHERKFYFGLVDQDYSYSEIKERDMKKPVRRESLAISPRLAKILINLSKVRKGELLLDPFCGIAGVLQEALILGLNVYGIDKDPRAIEDARKNLKWLEGKYEIKASYKLLNADAKNTPNIKFDGVATEPALGETFRHKPKDKEAKIVIESFERMIIGVLQRLKVLKKPNARIVFIAPYIRNFSIDIKKVCNQTKLTQLNIQDIKFPIRESREDQFISREVHILV
ncbi:MAG: hypothetical protein Q7S33_03950 [Nanoarchaeota archaeon]|nr:hypothetical protein [Nanoarchaeota archaeon]